jgi:hypothetical protein
MYDGYVGYAHPMLEQNIKSTRAEDTKANSVTLSFITLTASCTTDTFNPYPANVEIMVSSY